MWMVDPRIMCRKHLLGEHVETHMFFGTIKKGCVSLKGYVDNNLLEVSSLRERHDLLAKEMVRRGYRHQTPMGNCDRSKVESVQIDVDASLTELLKRCPECRSRYDLLLKGELDDFDRRAKYK